MTEPALQASSAIRVWVIPPTAQNAKGLKPAVGESVVGYVFPWSWGWKEARQLIPTTSVDNAGSMGQASFQLLRVTRQEIGRKAYAPLDDQLVVGAWICITSGSALVVDSFGRTTDQVDPAAILWVGWISSIDHEQLAGTSETIGTVAALGLGHLLDKRQIYGWAQAAVDGNYGVTINSPPQANMAGPENHVIGNAVLGTSPRTGAQVYVFARLPSECAPALLAQNDPSVWTRWRLLQHMLAFCVPNMGPGFAITAATADDAAPGFNPQTLTKLAGYLNDCTYPEVYDLPNLTWKGALDLLIPDTMGLGWYVSVTKAGWVVNLYSISDASPGDPTYYGLPVNPTSPTVGTVTLASEPTSAVTRRATAEDMPDEIVYESAEPCIFAFTVSFADQNLGKLWTAQQETDYKAAASGAVGYPTDPTKQKEINAAVRAGPGYRDVWTKFGLVTVGRNVLRAAQPVLGGPGSLALIPQLQWDGTTLKLDASTSRVPYLPAARFLRTLPWPEGLWADGTDHRDATSIATPNYLLPRVFRYDAASATNGGYPWVDLMARNGRPGFISAQLDVDDRYAAVRITASPNPELLAYKRWAGAPTPAPSDIDPESDGRAIDYTKLVLTAAMESDQRIQVIISRPGTQAQQPTAPGGVNVRRSLIVRDDKLHCWVTLKNTILALKGDNGGAPDYVTAAVGAGKFTAAQVISDASTGGGAGVLLRNDWPLAQLRANRLAAFVFRKRTAITIERARSDDQPAWAKLGTMITKAVEVTADTTRGTAVAEVSTLCGTVVVEISRTYGMRPRMRVSTGLPAMLSVGGGGGSPSPTSGGRVSLVGGGPVAAQVADVRGRVNAIEREGRAVVVPAKGGSAATKIYELQIIDGQTIYSSGATTFYGGKKKAGTMTTVTSLWDPVVSVTPGTFTAEDGICRAILFIDSVQQTNPVLVCHDSRSGNLIPLGLIKDDVIESSGPISLTLASDVTQSVTVYPARFL